MEPATAHPDRPDVADASGSDVLADGDVTPGSDVAPSGASSRWSNVAWIVSCVLLAVLVAAIWMRVGAGRSSAEITNAIVQGKRPAAPALPTQPVGDGTGLPTWYRAAGDHQAAGDDNQVLVVNWWASWCGPCRDEAPVFRDVAKDYDGRVTVVGLNAGAEDLRSDARAFAREQDLDFPLVRGDRGDKAAWGVTGYPETFVVGTDGRISSWVNGPIDSDTLRKLIDAELDEDRSAS